MGKLRIKVCSRKAQTALGLGFTVIASAAVFLGAASVAGAEIDSSLRRLPLLLDQPDDRSELIAVVRTTDQRRGVYYFETCSLADNPKSDPQTNQQILDRLNSKDGTVSCHSLQFDSSEKIEFPIARRDIVKEIDSAFPPILKGKLKALRNRPYEGLAIEYAALTAATLPAVEFAFWLSGSSLVVDRVAASQKALRVFGYLGFGLVVLDVASEAAVGVQWLSAPALTLNRAVADQFARVPAAKYLPRDRNGAISSSAHRYVCEAFVEALYEASRQVWEKYFVA